MAKTDNLLVEAIAEAKQVREAAIANAKAALEDVFTPHLASMLTNKLRKEAAIEETVNPGSSDIGTSDNKEPAASAKSSSNVPNPKQEVEAMGDGDSGADHKIGGSDPAPKGSDAHPEKLHEELPFEAEDDQDDDEDDLGITPGAPPSQDPAMQATLGGGEQPGADNFGGDDMGGDEMGGGEDLDLEALIRELEKDILGVQPEAAPVAAPVSAPMVATEETEMDRKFGDGDSGADPKIGGSDPAPKGSDAHPEKLHEEDDESVDEDIDLDEILREMDVQDQGTNPAHYAKVEELQTENATLKQAIGEHRNVIRFLKTRLEEVNMINAKLLFTNKLFKAFDLNAGQKMRVVETFDRATTPREVKIIYTTLAEAYTGKTASPSKKVKAITEGMASKPVGSTKPKSESILENSDAVRNRLKKLAGIQL